MLKAWVLSSTGCSSDTVACEAMKAIDVPFSTDLSSGTEALYVRRCLSLPTPPATDLNSFYFGITTANRDTNFSSAGANFAIREFRTALRPLQ